MSSLASTLPRTSSAPHGEVLRKSLGELCERSTKAGAGPRFVLSSETVDLMGDVVVQSGMDLVSDRIPAQIDHGGSMWDLIGWWHDFKREADRTTAELHLFEKGLSRAADLVRALVDGGVRLASSIGFVPTASEYIRDTKNDRITGERYLRSLLVEGSVVVVPANPDALSIAKSLLSPADRKTLEQLLAAPADRPSGQRPVATRAVAGVCAVNITERIQEGESVLAATRDALAAAQERLATDFEAESAQQELDALLVRTARESRSLQLLRDSEIALASRAVPAGQEGAAVRTTSGASGGAPAIVRRRPKASPDFLIRSAIIALESHMTRRSVDELIAQRYPEDEGTAMVGRMTIKAAQAPAMTNVPGWAAELVRDSFAAFMDLLAPASVVPRIPFMRFTFDGANSIKIPTRDTRTPNLAGAFRAEGAPIRVGAAHLASQALTPKSLGIIGTFTNELFERSTPNIETLIREFMLADTAVMLDGYFLSNLAPIAGISPGGIQNGLAAGNTRASTGKTVAQITADLQKMIAAMAGANLLARPVWIMNPVNASALAFAITAAGTPAFAGATINGGTLAGYPLVTSTTVPADLVMLVDGSGVAFAGGAPKFLGTDVATLHEESDPTLVSPISAVGTPNAVAAPLRSLYQTNSAALRALWEIDWKVLVPGAVQALTAVAWST